jgi:uncharacterized cupin superfamily protein
MEVRVLGGTILWGRAALRCLRNTGGMSHQIVDFSAALEAAASTPESDKLLAGNPRQTVANYFTDATEQFFAGRWSSTVGKWRIRYTESEFCCITRGRVALQNVQGDRWEFGPGAAFVVPAGFEGTWEVIEDCTKFYAIFEART